MGRAFVVSCRVVASVVIGGLAAVSGRDVAERLGRAETVQIARDAIVRCRAWRSPGLGCEADMAGMACAPSQNILIAVRYPGSRNQRTIQVRVWSRSGGW